MSVEVAAAPLPAHEAELRRLRLQVIAATWLSYAGFYMCRPVKVVGAVKGPLKEVLGASDLGIAQLTTAYLVTYMLGQFVTALLSRRYTSRSILLGGMTLSAFCSLAAGACTRLGAGGYWPMLVAVAVHGFGQATGWSANIGIMANWTRRAERGRVMAAWSTCYQLGSAAAKAFAGFMLGALGLAWAFYGSSLLLFGVVALFYFWGKESPEHAGLPAAREDDLETAPAAGGSSAAKAGDDAGTSKAGEDAGAARAGEDAARIVRAIVAMGLIYFSFKFLRYALDSWSALILEEHFALPAGTAAYISTAFDLLGFAGVVFAGWASDRFFKGLRVPVIFFGAAATLVATLLLWAVGLQSVWLFAVLLGMVGFSMMGPDALLSGAAAQDVGGRRWAVIAAGVINGLGSIGPIVQEEVIGWLKGAAGVTAVLLLLVGVATAATLGSGAFWISTRARNQAI